MSEPARNFIRARIDADLAEGRVSGVVTRFPPEPNGYLHIGHAKSICLNFGIARDYAGRCHLRFDDTNPIKEDTEYVESILEDVRWLGFDWGPHLYYASDYFEQLWTWAEALVLAGKAFVCDLSAEEVRRTRGTLTQPGTPSPYRDRSPSENLDLFRRMRAGEFPDGSRTLRAKIDMAASNLNLRDPVLYRVLRATHHRTGDAWCVYPTYDWAHGQSDAIEGITHSICTLEFEDHRPLYDWFLEQIGPAARPRQIEFARLNLTYTVMSKRMLLQLVREGHVSGWDDPRLPTVAGLRRRGYTPASLRAFADRIGVAKADSTVDIGLLESCIRDDLNPSVARAMCVHRPVRLVLVDWPEDRVEWIEAPWFPDEPGRMGSRRVPFGKVAWIEQDDFMEDPPRKYYRLAPGREVRLRWGCIVKCVDVVRDAVSGAVTEVHCTHDPTTFGALPADGRRVRGILHWVSAAHAVPATLRLYDRLFSVPNPASPPEGRTFLDLLDPGSLEVLQVWVEPSLAGCDPGTRWQFERRGYYVADSRDCRPGHLVFNRIVPLRDSWAKELARTA
ncbi:MAG: glutamine--tRNA ligase/YqeY domain fusion protein [Deltaproteobacteria bacterium]|nr:glutamine--tRNA ligase/YqeY domain fusion protein [Deltaproteobacteria bacterium]